MQEQQEQQIATLTTVFSEVLANLTFMFSDDADACASPGAVWVQTTISYKGTSSGTLRLACTRAFCDSLAANLLGLDPDDEAVGTQSDDAVKEFMNVICGQFITNRHGTHDVFNLSIPIIEMLEEAPDLYVHNAPDLSTLSVDGHPVQLVYEPEPEG